MAKALDMLALRKMQPGASGLVLADVAVPMPLQGEALIEVFAAGICGTDLHIMDGSYASAPPVTLGHEFCGRVVAVADGVDESLIGERVAVRPPVSCGDCEWCELQLPMHCVVRKSLGSSLDGGFATHVVAPARNLHSLPDSLPDRLGALVEPLACVCNGLFDPIVVGPGDRVVVIGPGPIGLLAAQVAVACGGDVTVVGLARDAERLEIAGSLGLDARCLEAPEAVRDLEEEGRERRIGVVIECAGAAASLIWGLSILRPRGTLVQLGLLSDESLIPLGGAVLREIRLRTSYGSTPMSWTTAIQLLEDDEVQLGPLVSAVRPLRDWEEAVRDFHAGVGLKTLFDPHLL